MSPSHKEAGFCVDLSQGLMYSRDRYLILYILSEANMTDDKFSKTPDNPGFATSVKASLSNAKIKRRGFERQIRNCSWRMLSHRLPRRLWQPWPPQLAGMSCFPKLPHNQRTAAGTSPASSLRSSGLSRQSAVCSKNNSMIDSCKVINALDDCSLLIWQ